MQEAEFYLFNNHHDAANILQVSYLFAQLSSGVPEIRFKHL